MSGPVRRFAALSTAVLALTLASGCGAQPDTAVRVNDTRIPLTQVDDDVSLLCSPGLVAQVVEGRVARSLIRSRVASLRATETLLTQYRAERRLSVDPELRKARSQVATGLGAEAGDRADALAGLLTVGGDLSDVLAQSGPEEFNAWLADQEVSFDPRMRLDAQNLTLGDPQRGELLTFTQADVGSIALSAPARAATDPEVAGDRLSALGPEQVCGVEEGASATMGG